MPAGFYVASRWGLGAVAAAWLILAPVTVLPLTVKLLRIIELPISEYLGVLVPAAAGSLGMLAAVMATRVWLLGVSKSPAINLAIMVCVGGVVYTAILMALFRARVIRYVHFLQGLRKGERSLAAG